MDHKVTDALEQADTRLLNAQRALEEALADITSARRACADIYPGGEEQVTEAIERRVLAAQQVLAEATLDLSRALVATGTARGAAL